MYTRILTGAFRLIYKFYGDGRIKIIKSIHATGKKAKNTKPASHHQYFSHTKDDTLPALFLQDTSIERPQK